MDKFWELFERSIIIQSLVTMLLVCTICYMYLAQRDVPEHLWMITELVIGFWMGTKVQSEVQRRVASKNDGS